MCLLLFLPPLQAAADDHGDAAAGDIYIDQLIEPATADEQFDPVYLERMEQPEGRRYLSAGLVNFLEDRGDLGDSFETGLEYRYRRETHDYGEIETQAALLEVDAAADRTSAPSSGGLLTVTQRDFALSNSWVMDNSVGVSRTMVDPVLANSFRFKLPSSVLLGAGTRMRYGDNEVQLGYGRLGNLDTGRVQTYDRRDGTLLSAGFSRSIADRYHTALQLVSVNDAENVADHESLAGVLQYVEPDKGRRVQSHLLVDSEGAAGLWLDGDIQSGAWRQRIGAFRFEPGLLWTDASMSNDVMGLYARAERRTLRYAVTGGIEINSTDIDRDPEVPGLRTSTIFVTGNRYIDRKTSMGGTFTIQSVRSPETVESDDRRDTGITIYTSHQMPSGVTRVQTEFANIRNGSNHGFRSGLTWDQSLYLARNIVVTGTLGFDAERDTGNDENRTMAGVLYNHDFAATLRWDASFNWTHFKNRIDDRNGDAVNASMALLWRFLPGWEAVLRARYNEASETAASGLETTDFTGREKTLLMSVRYNRASGRSFERYGRATGSSGYGSVEGIVFYDENRDGIRQAGEPVAENIYVYLDRRYPQVTDRDGRFEYSTVPAGRHDLRIMLEDIPLPWGLDDEEPVTVDINVRGRSRVEFPLVRFDGQG